MIRAGSGRRKPGTIAYIFYIRKGKHKMPSPAYNKFLKNLESVNRLQATYHDLRNNRSTRGRAAWDHITRSAFIFLASSFEVYIEDVLTESISKHIKYAGDAPKLPNDVKDTLNKYVRKDSNGVPPTDLCDEGWKTVYRNIGLARTEKLNTPKVENIKLLFKELIGAESIITTVPDIGKLDDIISFRGEIAHRVRADEYVKIDTVEDAKKVISDIAKAIDRGVLQYLRTTYSGKRMDWYDVY